MSHPVSPLPKVSVVVTTYNQEGTIARTLDSILAQQCDFPFEIELSDDCSTDNTPGVCRRYAAAHPGVVRYHRNETNRGCRDNYFDTLLRCRAPYIADCAGDDYWTDPLKLAKQAAVLDSHPEVVMVHTAWEYTDADTGAVIPCDMGPLAPVDTLTVTTPEENFLPTLRHEERPFIHLCSAMYRKEVFEREYAADTDLFRNPAHPCEDFPLKVIYARNGSIAYLPDITFRYTIGHKSVSSLESHTKTFDFYFDTLRLTLRLIEKYAVGRSDVDGALTRMSAFLFAEAYFARDKARVEKLLGLMRANAITLPPKSKLLLPTLRSPLLWNIAATAKSIVHRLKTRGAARG